MRRFAYTVLMFVLIPAALLHLWWRSRRQPEYFRRIFGERFGRYALEVRQPLIWVHAVSVGETRAAEPLVRPRSGIRITAFWSRT